MFFRYGPAQVAGPSLNRPVCHGGVDDFVDGGLVVEPRRGLARRLTEALIGADDCSSHVRIHSDAFVGRRG
jgi:hypothetical protein